MSAPTIDRPDTSGTTGTGATGAPTSTKSARRGDIMGKIIAIVAVVLVMIAGYALGSAKANSSKTSALREAKRTTAERELTAYASDKDLPVTNISVSFEGNTLMASWTQGDQTCSAPVVLKDNKSFYSALAVKQGSGSCITKTASDGIGGGNGG